MLRSAPKGCGAERNGRAEKLTETYTRSVVGYGKIRRDTTRGPRIGHRNPWDRAGCVPTPWPAPPT
nr:MAG TPA: hypothetical protein [Caudoviricetes sp.]